MLRTAKILQILFILAIPIYLDILRQVVPPLVSVSSDTLNLITFILAVLGVVDLSYSYFLPKLMIKGYKRKPLLKENQFLLSVYVCRAAMFEAVAIYGLILGFLGAGLEIVAPFFIAAVAGLIFTFPTQTRWNKVTAEIAGLSKPNSIHGTI